MKQSLGLIAMMGAAMAIGQKGAWKPNYLSLMDRPPNTGSHHAKSSHKQNRRTEIARRRA